MKPALFILGFLTMAFLPVAQAQQAVKVPLSFRVFAQEAAGAEPVHLFLKGEEAEVKNIVASLGGHFKYAFKGYSAVWLPAAEVLKLNDYEEIEAVHFEYGKGEALLDNSLNSTRVSKVHQGLGLPQAYTGQDVIVGIIDAGLDLNHEDMQYANGNTRVIELWDQNMTYSSTRTPAYGYGQVWDSAEINNGICPHVDQASYFGHGTNTTGIATGNAMATGQFKGVAPNSEIILVSSNFNAFGWTATIADAVDYIFERAEAYGKPCVINISLGTYVGSHDGHDIPALFIDEKITESNGRAVVCAAGNSGNQTPYHLGYEATADTNFTWFKTATNATIGQGSIFFELYGSRNDFERVQFAVGADKTSPGYAFRGTVAFDSVPNRLNILYDEDLMSLAGNYLGHVQTWADSAQGTYRLQVLISYIDSIQYKYRLSITGSGRFDLWSGTFLGTSAMVETGLPSSTVFPPITYYKIPDIRQSIVSSWACSDKVITVGNYTNRITYTDVDGNVVLLTGQTAGAIAASSSLGPSRLGSVKPEVAAPGDNTLAPGAQFQINAQLANISQRNRVAIGGRHHRASGTSSASPVVAGIGALFFELCPNASWEDFKQALVDGAVADQFTSQVPNDLWGHGKVDALNTMKLAVPNPAINAPDNDFCAGDSLTMALVGSFPSINWSTGATTQAITVDQGGVYFAEVHDEKGCRGFSDTLSVFKRPLPDKPQININGDNPSCANVPVELTIPDEAGAYEWSSGAHTQSITVNEAGSYFCVVSTIHLCQAVSDTVNLVFYPANDSPLIHLQQGGVLAMTLDTALATAYRWYYNGDTVTGAHDVIHHPSQPGYYKGAYLDENGCEWISNELNVYALGLQTHEPGSWQVYPIPFGDHFILRTNGEYCSWQLHNMFGQCVLSGSGSSVQTIDTTTLSSGSYTLTAGNDRQNMVKVLVKR